eukprot:TRINITY_DN3122_c0_g1_i1.p1 TRINITY_DN3122_c0_g1~~TRINITY_DN3122_c0_g1_i1.p1  ORF type:complete len:128 (-),score=29.26 TRINITY_DN3122_c0_g1_i1:385-768(-)
MSFDAGSVPIYIGAPNVKWFVPSPDSYINADDFKSVKELANHILYLDKNATAYNEYLRWKTDGWDDHFQALFDFSTAHSICRTCAMTADMLRHDFGDTPFDKPLSIHQQQKFGWPEEDDGKPKNNST